MSPAPRPWRLALRWLGIGLLIGLGPDTLAAPPSPEDLGTLTLVILDAVTGQPVPARVEVLDSEEESYVAADALPVLVGVRFAISRAFPDPVHDRNQFYSTGRSTLSLPPGDYALSVWKGLEYRVKKEVVTVAAGAAIEHTVSLDRWISMPARHWYSADDHIHLPRPTPELNDTILQWMAAEDIHVANLLQMGSYDSFDYATQYAHGPEGHYGDGRHVLISGQENPRSHVLGHMIILGTKAPIHYPDHYLDLPRYFAEGHRQGAVNGVAHFGRIDGAHFGLGLILPRELLDFLEVLQAEIWQYDLWYKVLNTGYRLTPTAGTDYPFVEGPPGRERFYTRVRGRLTPERWLEAVRGGHTFVTNGPMLELSVNGHEMGDTLHLSAPGTVEIEARVLFNPQQEAVNELEVVENGFVVRTFPAEIAHGSRIERRFEHQIDHSGWLAIRVDGFKHFSPLARQAQAHSAPVYVTVDNATPLARQEEARHLARSWLLLLDDLEAELAEEHIDTLAEEPGFARVDAATIRRDRPTILRAIQEARALFRARSRAETEAGAG